MVGICGLVEEVLIYTTVLSFKIAVNALKSVVLFLRPPQQSSCISPFPGPSRPERLPSEKEREWPHYWDD